MTGAGERLTSRLAVWFGLEQGSSLPPGEQLAETTCSGLELSSSLPPGNKLDEAACSGLEQGSCLPPGQHLAETAYSGLEQGSSLPPDNQLALNWSRWSILHTGKQLALDCSRGAAYLQESSLLR